MTSFNRIALVFLVSLGSSIMGTRLASAATIQVNTTNCSFDDAVSAVTNQFPVAGCAAGDGNSDTIKIPAGTFEIASGGPDWIMQSVSIVGAGNTTVLHCATAATISPSAIIIAPAADLASITVGMSQLAIVGTNSQQAGTAVQQFVQLDQTTSVTLDKVNISGFGGGFDNFGGSTTIKDSVFNHTANSTPNDDVGTSAALYNTGVMTISGSTLENNFGSSTGAALVDDGGTVSVIDTTFEYNDSAGDGGGLVLYDGGTASISNSTFYGNEASNIGGAIFVDGSRPALNTLSVDFTTIANNYAGQQVGGLYVDYGDVTAPKLKVDDCIIATNISGGSDYADVSADFAGSGRNLIGSHPLGAIINPPSNTIWWNGSALFGALSSDGSAPDTLSLVPGSEAIDREPGPFPPGVDTLDERGFPRPLDGLGTGVAKYDLGAFEYDPWQIERLIVAAKTSGITYRITSGDPGYSNQAGGTFYAKAANEYITYAVPVTVAGTYKVLVRSKLGNNRGEYQLSTATSLNGTYTKQGGVKNLYSAAGNAFSEVLVGTETFSAGTKYFKFSVTGKATASSDYYLTLDYIKLIKQ